MCPVVRHGGTGSTFSVCGWPDRPRLIADAINADPRVVLGFARRVRLATVDHFGEQSVQVMATVINAAIVLLMAVAFMLLSVRLARLAIPKPALARVPLHTGRLVLPERSDMPSELRLQRSLPTRGPPGSMLYGLTSSPPQPASADALRAAGSLVV